MTATVSVKQETGATPTVTTITALRFNTDDTSNPGTRNSLVKPATGINRSYAKTIYLNADTSPTGIINNVRIYSDGAIGWTGCTVYIGTTTNYVQKTGTEATSGDDDSVATADLSTFVVGSPKTVTGEILNPNTGRITDRIIMQVDLNTDAIAGVLNPETITFQYDET